MQGVMNALFGGGPMQNSQIAPEWLRELMRPGRGPAIGPRAPRANVTPIQDVTPQPLVHPDEPYVPKGLDHPYDQWELPGNEWMRPGRPVHSWVPALPNEQGARNIPPHLLQGLVPLNQGQDNPMKWIPNDYDFIPPPYENEEFPIKETMTEYSSVMDRLPELEDLIFALDKNISRSGEYIDSKRKIQMRPDVASQLLAGKDIHSHELQHGINAMFFGTGPIKKGYKYPLSQDELLAYSNAYGGDLNKSRKRIDRIAKREQLYGDTYGS